jgi:hypothetical protein
LPWIDWLSLNQNIDQILEINVGSETRTVSIRHRGWTAR